MVVVNIMIISYTLTCYSQVVWRWWKISPRIVDRYSKPGELKQSHEDFLDDTWLHSKA